MNADSGRAALGVWNDFDAGADDEYTEWYQHEHLPERLGVPGFLDVRRGVALSGAPKYCALYTLESLEVLRTPFYLERLANPTPRTRAIMPRFRNMNRSACAITLSRGAGVGGVLVTLALTPQPGRAGALRDAIDAQFAALVQLPCVLRAQLWETDRSLSVLNTEEQSLRSQPDAASDWVAVLDLLQADASACGAVTDALRRSACAAAVGAPSVYRLLCYRS